MTAILLQPRTQDQFDMLSNMARVMRISYNTVPEEQAASVRANFLSNVQRAAKQAYSIAEGTVEGQSLDSLIDELR